MKYLFATCLSLLAFMSIAQTSVEKYPIVPKPQQLVAKDGNFVISPTTIILLEDDGQKNAANFLNDYLQRFVGFKLKTSKVATKNFIRLGVKRLLRPGTEGKYDVSITPTSINISGDTYAGTFYGVQTILQLTPVKKATKVNIPCAEIFDEPRFGYRGLHLDVCRHFMPVDFVKKYIDYIAYYKLNTFHWHLTDDQGWRIEIKKYPKLTSVGAWRDGTIVGRYPGTKNDNLVYGGFYTQEQIKDVVKYASDRFVTVIPEIEMPGHASAAIAAYPELSCFPDETTIIPTIPSEASKAKTGKKVQETWGVFDDVFCPNDNTFKFLEDVIDEVMPLFPSAYIHIGGDECPKSAWKRSAFCQQLIKDKGLKDEHGLQSYFIQHMEKYINGKGKKIIGWDEILEGGLAPNATVMSWQGEKGGIEAAKQQHQVIMTPGAYVYFDHSQSKNEDSVTIGGYLPLDMVYNYDPVPASLTPEEGKMILGAQANVWTEYIGSPAKVEYTIFPRLAALSEVLWTKKENKSWDDFEKRLPTIFDRFDKTKTNYSAAYYELKATVLPAPNNEGLLWKVETKANKPITITRDKDDSVVIYAAPVPVSENGILFATCNIGSRETRILQEFRFNKATGKPIALATPPSDNYPGNGAFTLVDGVQNDKRLARSIEFIGYNGKDCEATIDLGKTVQINSVVVHTLSQEASWIYSPSFITVFVSTDNVTFTEAISVTTETEKVGNAPFKIDLPADKANARYVRVLIKNHGTIESGKQGAGNPAWLFVDEIEIL